METRARILARDNGLCRCDACSESGSPKPATEVDHAVPLWEGGADDDSNLRALNAECHKLKSAREADKRAALQYKVPAAAGSPLEFLVGVMNDLEQDPRLRVRAAVAAAQYLHDKRADGGKKDERKEAAEKAGRGRYASPAPPKLVVNNA